MKKNIFKVTFIFFIICGILGSYVYATDIDINLPSITPPANEDTNNDPETPAENQTPDTEDPNSENPDGENPTEENPDGENSGDGSDIAPLDDGSETIDSEVLQPSTLSNAPEDGLGTTNIINIILITVGVILILLSIAILIRLK